MNTKKIIESWNWRIKKAGYTQNYFSGLVGVSPSSLTGYMNGTIDMPLSRFNAIEEKLKELGV